MDIAALERYLTTALYVSAGIAAVYGIVRFLLVNIQSRKTNNAPIETARAVVYWKDPEPKQQLLGRHSSWIYYITFHTDCGQILELYLPGEKYFTLEEGDTGLLTWQANRFWKFEKEE